MNDVHPRPVPEQQPADVTTLHDLIQMLYPDPNPDVFTLEAFLFRHKLTGLGESAIRSIEKSQRISRQIGNYQQGGLCAFHVGLIYLSVRDYRGAREQFEKARQQWSFVYDPAAVGLALFAEGVAQQLAFHFEDAMACYTKANQWLPRIRFAPPAHYPEQFLDALTQALHTRQQQLHDTLWEETETAVTEEAAAGEEAAEGETAVEEPPTPATADAAEAAAAETAAETAPAATSPAQPTPMPIIHMDSPSNAGIIPGHEHVSSRYEWYLIERQPPADFFPADVQRGGWLLVDKTSRFSSGELVLVGMGNGNEPQERVLVRPMGSLQPRSRIYLAWLDDPSGAFSIDADTGTVTFSPTQRQVPIQLEEILGVVVGFWLPVQIQ